MFVRWKEAKYSQISIYQFFGRQHENRHAIAYSKILRKMAVICKSYKNTLIRVFLHAEFIFALKREPKPTVFEKYAKNRKKNICYHYFLFFVIFSISFKQNFLKPNESCLLDRKKPNIAKLAYINFLAVSMKIACSKILRKEAVFCKSYKNTLIRVFLHAEFIFALKTEPKPTVFEKYAENRKKIYLLSLFSFFVIFSISFKQNFLKPNESCLLDRKKPNIAKSVYINFLAVSMKIAMLQPVRKFSEKRLFSANPIKIPLFSRAFLHAEFISAQKMEAQPTVFEKYADNRKKNRKKDICYHYFLFFVIFSINFEQNFLKPNESSLLDRKKPNIAKLVYINFLAVSMKIAMLQPVRKFSEKWTVFCKSYKNTLIRVFLHAEFISALKTEPKPTVFDKYAENRKKYICYHYFLFFVIFSFSFKQNFLKPNESCLLDGKKPNIAKLIYINFLELT